MNADKTTLTCPYCAATYQEGASVCPKCGRSLSPTGYSQYGVAEAPLPVVAQAEVVMPAEMEADRIRRAATRNQQFNRTIGVILWVIIATAALFFILSRFPTLPRNNVADLQITPQPTMPFYFPPAVQGIVPTDTPVYQPDPNAGRVKINHVRVLATTAGTLVANIYDLGASSSIYATTPVPALFPPLGVFSAAGIGSSGGAVIFGSYNVANKPITATNFTRIELLYRRGSVLLPVVNGALYSDSLIILSSNGITVTEHFPRANFVVAGQLIAGFDVLDRLTSSDKVINDQIGPLAAQQKAPSRDGRGLGWQQKALSLEGRGLGEGESRQAEMLIVAPGK